MMPSSQQLKGPIAWMTRNHVAANLVMLIFIVGGYAVSTQVTQEFFPDIEVDRISVSVSYPGASPEEVEQGIILSIEDVVRGIDGVKKVTANALEGVGSVAIELLTGANVGKALQDVKNAIDRIQSFPEEAERPEVSLVQPRRKVLTLMVYGDQDERTHRSLAEKVRDDLINRTGITLVELEATRPLEIAIEVSQQNLRSYNLTLDAIAERISLAAIELPAGGVKTEGGEILIRTQERRDFASQYADIPIVISNDGSTVTLGDIAELKDGFEDTDQEAYFNDKRAIRVDVYRVGKETPQSISDNVRSYIQEVQPDLPEHVGLAIWDDNSEIYRDRIRLLLKNAALGLVFVLIMLGLFLDPRLAFWVTLGIPVSILGSFLFIPLTGATINMISLFAFIVTLGIIVDDAVVVGENIYEKRSQGIPYLQAAIEGAREIATPVVFAVLTNIAAFVPLFFVPGSSGNLFRQIPSVTVMVFIISLIESLFVLPAHLAHKHIPSLFWKFAGYPQRLFGRLLSAFIERVYKPTIGFVIAFRYLAFAIGLAILFLAIGIIAGGHIGFTYVPRIDRDVVTAQATLPFGVPMESARKIRQRLIAAAERTIEENGGHDIVKGIYTQIGSPVATTGRPSTEAGAGTRGSHLVGVQVALVPSDQRTISGTSFAKAWRESVANIAELETLSFRAETGRDDGSAIDIQLNHRSRDVLERAAAELAELLKNYAGVKDIDDGVALGKPQMSFRIRPEARSLGINTTQLARQVRTAFYGAEALRQQRGRNEVKVMVRLPEKDRKRYHTVEQLILRTEAGSEIPLAEAVDVEERRSYTTIRRQEVRRIIAVTADVDETVSNANTIINELVANELPDLIAKYPGLNYSLEGEQSSQRETLGALAIGFILTLFVLYGLLAIPFKSYTQPLVVMLSIPFGIIGAVIGHILLGYQLSIISMFGVIALAGVVVNDSMVLIVTANTLRQQEGVSAVEAIFRAGVRRFRPIMLTSLTTFFGLAPMIFETSVQARFLIPMAISIGFGILFSTIIILAIVPSVYLILEDILNIIHRTRTLGHRRSEEVMFG